MAVKFNWMCALDGGGYSAHDGDVQDGGAHDGGAHNEGARDGVEFYSRTVLLTMEILWSRWTRGKNEK